MSEPKEQPSKTRKWIARAFTVVEDVVYIGLGLLLAGIALTLLAQGISIFAKDILYHSNPIRMVDLLDKILLILLVVELLYTVQVSFREHALMPEPFLLVGMISAIRRVLVLTAEIRDLQQQPGVELRDIAIELAVLTALILALVISLILLRKRDASGLAKRA